MQKASNAKTLAEKAGSCPGPLLTRSSVACSHSMVPDDSPVLLRTTRSRAMLGSRSS